MIQIDSPLPSQCDLHSLKVIPRNPKRLRMPLRLINEVTENWPTTKNEG